MNKALERIADRADLIILSATIENSRNLLENYINKYNEMESRHRKERAVLMLELEKIDVKLYDAYMRIEEALAVE